ncbi:MAG: hypothetical protein ABEH77_09265 [Halobacteriaceae archaeon]
MASFGRAGLERVNAFRVGDQYMFRHYFEEEAVFAELGEFYEEYDYRFEVPADRFDEVVAFLERNGYTLIEQEPGPFFVVKRKYTDHPDVLFESAVLQRSVDNFNAFLMADQAAVERAVEGGARRLSETGLAVPL